MAAFFSLVKTVALELYINSLGSTQTIAFFKINLSHITMQMCVIQLHLFFFPQAAAVDGIPSMS